MVINGAIQLGISNQYERPHDPPPKPEYVSVTDKVIDVPGVQNSGPLIDKVCVIWANDEFAAMVRPTSITRSILFIPRPNCFPASCQTDAPGSEHFSLECANGPFLSV